MQEFRVAVDAPAKKGDKPTTHIVPPGQPLPATSDAMYLVDALDEAEARKKAAVRYASGEGLSK